MQPATVAGPRPHAWLAALALAALTLAVRWPFHDVVGEDESFFLVIAHQWRLGLAPYVGAFDVKPPGLFAMVAVAEALFGSGVVAIKALECAAVAATAITLYLFGRRFLTPTAGFLGGVLYVAASLDLSGVELSAELLASAFVAPAMLIGLSALRARRPAVLVIAGALIGAAVCVKQPAAFEGLVLMVATLEASKGARIRTSLALLAGMAIAPVGFLLFYALTGHVGALLDDAVLGAVGRMKGDNLSWADAVLRMAPMLKPVMPLVIGALLLWVERGRVRSKPFYPALIFLARWTAGALAGVLAVKAMYDHYYLTLLAPLSLLTGVFIDQVAAQIGPQRLRALSRAGLVAGALAFLLRQPLPLLGPAEGEVAAEEQVSSQLRALGARPEDHILVLGRHLAVYLFAAAEPPTGVFHPMQLLCPFPQLNGRDALSEAFAHRPNFVILPDPATRMLCELPQRRREIAAALASDYCAVGRSASFVSNGAPDRITIYGRRDRLGRACRPDIPPPVALLT